MKKSLKIDALQDLATRLLAAAGLSDRDAATVAKVYMNATLRDQGHHDIGMLPNRIEALCSGTVKAKPKMRLVQRYGAVERYDGDNGLGELACDWIMKRAQSLADTYGIGFATVCHSNHNMANAPYVDEAARAGYLAYLVTRGAPTMGAPGRPEKVVGTAPMGFATETDAGPISHDVCMAYLANSALSEAIDKKKDIPNHWGLDSDGKPTTDPEAVQSGTRLPIGSHKGFGLAVLGEILTGVLSGGQVIDQPHPESGHTAVTAHTAIAIQVEALLPREAYLKQTGEMIRRMRQRAPGLRIPGQESQESRTTALKNEEISIDVALWQRLRELAEGLSLTSIPDA